MYEPRNLFTHSAAMMSNANERLEHDVFGHREADDSKILSELARRAHPASARPEDAARETPEAREKMPVGSPAHGIERSLGRNDQCYRPVSAESSSPLLRISR